jgi:hypothetical protein
LAKRRRPLAEEVRWFFLAIDRKKPKCESTFIGAGGSVDSRAKHPDWKHPKIRLVKGQFTANFKKSCSFSEVLLFFTLTYKLVIVSLIKPIP